MRMLLIAGALFSMSLPAAGQDGPKEWCAQAAPVMRDMAVRLRELLNVSLDILPEGLKSDVRSGAFDENGLRANATVSSAIGMETLEAAIATARLFAPLQDAAERYEIAASALEACASKQGVE